MQKLFLLDAYALIYRAYYAFIKNPRINSKGENTSAILGFVNTLEEVLQKEKPTHIGVAFDPHGGTFRHEAYPAYKAQREETPEAIRFAVPKIKEILAAYRIPVLEVAGFEADDVIGTLSHQAHLQGIQTYMMTPDKDYGQLVNEHVSMYRPAKGGEQAEVMGVEEVKAKWGLKDPTQVIDLLGLMGDTSDNIPGCPGVGEKTAVKLINEYGSIEVLLEQKETLKGALKDKICGNADLIQTSKWLATIRTDVPIALDMDQLKFEEADKEALKTLYDALEFYALTKKMFGASPVTHPASKASQRNNKSVGKTTADNGQLDLFAMFDETPNPASVENAETTETTLEEALPTARETWQTRQAKYTLVNTAEARQRLISTLLQAETVCLDTETDSTEPIRATLVGLSFAVKEGEAWYVPVPKDEAERKQLMEEFRPVYENPETMKIGQNLKYDLLVLQNPTNGAINLAGPMFDTMIAHYLISPELHHGMDYMAEIYLNYQTIHIEELIGPKGKKQKSMADLTPEEIYIYASEDAEVTLRLKNALEPRLKECGVEELFWQIEMPLMPVLAYMERCGVCVDTEGLKETSRLFTERMQQLEKEIHELAGVEFNIASPKQVGEVLFEKLQLSNKPKKTKTGQYVTSEEVLESLRHKHPAVEKILQHRGLKKLLGTYIDALPELINPTTGHIHTSFNQTIAATGRLSSSNPNLQNIPVRDAEGKEVRKAFIPEAGEEFFSADYSQIELRIMAHLSQDENLIQAFRAGHDIHAATAAKIFHKDISEVTSDERRKAKTANFGIIYGISAFGLAERIGCSRSEAKQLIDGYFETYPGVKSYMDKSIATVREQGYTETLFHRRLTLPDINSHNSVVRGYAERNAINAPIQGTAADIIKVAMIRIHQRMKAEGLQSKMMLQVHDELNFSVPAEEKEHLQQLVIEEMQAATTLRVPLLADCGWGKNWLEAH
ncbi:MAG: DNA polymerase I [Bacteroidaceae bacterium]|nr:DNA polymerase I [Bacteroidaceae bacterium]